MAQPSSNKNVSDIIPPRYPVKNGINKQLVFALLVFYFLTSFQRICAPGTLFNELQADYALSASQIALLGSLFAWLYGSLQLVAGYWVDRAGGSRLFLFGGAFLLLGAISFPLSTSITTLFAARLLTSFGASFIYLSLVKFFSTKVAATHFAQTLSLFLAIGHAGGFMATLPLERLAHRFGWRPSLLVIAALMGLCYAFAFSFLRRSAPLPQHTPTSTESLPVLIKKLITNRASQPILLSTLIAFPTFYTFQTLIGKKILEDTAHCSSPVAAGAVLLLSILVMLCVPLGGSLFRPFGCRHKPIIYLSATALTLSLTCLFLCVFFSLPLYIFFIGYSLLGTSVIASASLLDLLKQFNPPQHLGFVLSFSNATAFIGSGIIDQLCGTILNAFPTTQTAQNHLTYPATAYLTLIAFLGLLSLLNFFFSHRIREPEVPRN